MLKHNIVKKSMPHPHHITSSYSDIQLYGGKSIPHNVLIVSPTEMHQSAAMVTANYAGSISDSSPLPPTATDTKRPTLKRMTQSREGRRNGWNEWQKDR